jgi:hypothetical protein
MPPRAAVTAADSHHSHDGPNAQRPTQPGNTQTAAPAAKLDRAGLAH